MRESLEDVLLKAVSEKIFPGCVVCVVSRDEKPLIVPVGKQTYEHTSPEVSASTIYDIASVTKSIPVASLALTLIDTGKVALDAPIKPYVPELQMRHADAITLRHLLMQTLDYRVSLATLKQRGAETVLGEIFSADFSSPPGERMNYANATSVLLGLVIERISGKSLDVYAEEIFFRPLGMKDTTFHPDKIVTDRIAPTEDDPWRKGVIQGEIHDESSYLLRQHGMIPGSAGVFSTAPDLGKFLSMVLHEGIYAGRRYFSEEMIALMQENQLEKKNESVSLGWELNQARYMGRYANPHMIGKTGFTGCVVMCDIPRKRGLVMLSNYHFPHRKSSVEKLNTVRAAVADLVFA